MIPTRHRSRQISVIRGSGLRDGDTYIVYYIPATQFIADIQEFSLDL